MFDFKYYCYPGPQKTKTALRTEQGIEVTLRNSTSYHKDSTVTYAQLTETDLEMKKIWAVTTWNPHSATQDLNIQTMHHTLTSPNNMAETTCFSIWVFEGFVDGGFVF